MLRFLILGALAVSLPAYAQYKCTIKGQTVYSDQPCAVDAKHVGSPLDKVPEDQLRQRLQQSIKERQWRNDIEAREAVEDAEREREKQVKQAQAAARADADRRDRTRRCDQMRRDLRNNDQARARYQDFGWQNSLRQRETEARGLRESIERDCRN